MKKIPMFLVTHESIDDDAVGRKRRNCSFNATHLDTYMYVQNKPQTVIIFQLQKREFIVKIWCMKSKRNEERESKNLLSFFLQQKKKKKKKYQRMEIKCIKKLLKI